MANIPTATEQGYDVDWSIVRGFYVGPKVSDADYKVWVDTFTKLLASPAFDKLRSERGLFPIALTGAPLDAYVKKQVAGYRKLAKDFGLNVTPAK
jgi:putative tricarboxylic transport membrane protein